RSGADRARVTPSPVEEPAEPSAGAVGIPFWYARTFAVHAPLAHVGEQDPAETAAVANEREAAPIVAPELASARSILTRLRRLSALRRVTSEPDLERIVRRLSRGHLLESVPFRSRQSWGQSIQVIKDRSERLMPYWADQDDVTEWLCRI